jgi:tetratricopeptide (TPR) repeat protein
MVTTKNRVCNLCAALLASATLLAGCSPPGERALTTGEKLLREHRYAEAVEHLKSATSLLSSNALAWNALGIALHHSDKPLEAEKAYQKAVSLNRDLAEARFNLGCLLLEQGRFDAARSEFVAYAFRRPNALDGLLKLASAQMRLRDYAAAEKTYSEVLRVNAASAEALNGLGVIRLQRGKPAEAAAFFNSALRQQTNYSPAVLNLAVVSHVHMRDKAAALRLYRDYLALEPGASDSESVQAAVRVLQNELSPPPLASRAPATNNSQIVMTSTSVPAPASGPAGTAPQVSSATPSGSTAAGRSPVTNAPQAAGRGQAPNPTLSPPKPGPAPVTASKQETAAAPSKTAGQPSTAARTSSLSTSAPTSGPTDSYQSVTLPPEPVLKPAQDSSQLGAAQFATASSPLVTTSSIPADARQSKPQKRGILRSLNPLNLFQGEKERKEVASATSDAEASRLNQPAQELPSAGVPAFARYRYRSPGKPAPGNRNAALQPFSSGLQFQSAKRYNQAIEAYEKALEQDPAFFEAHYNVGLCYAALGKYEKSLGPYETALAIIPDYLEARLYFGLALQHASYVPDAVDELEKVISQYPNETRAHLALANIYAQQLKQPDLARLHYRKVLEVEPQHAQASAIRYWLSANP